jgi:hypothetical protein
MANERVRQIYQYVAVSGAGKKQSAFGVFMPNADIDVREKCEVTISDNVDRDAQYDCDGVDLIREPIRTRDTVVELNYNEGFTPQMLARWLAYKEGAAAAPSGSTVNEVQTFARTGTVSGGTLTWSYTIEGKTGTTEAIAYNATAAQIQTAMLKKTGTANAMGKLFKAGDVVVSGDWTGGIVLTFGGRFAAAVIPAPTVGVGSLTGSTPGISVTETAAGSQKSHAITRSTDGALPLFSIVVGDKNSAYDHHKYGDAVVNGITFSTEQAAGALVQMTVSILCNYTPEKESGYSVPACVNISPLKVEDCKVKIAGTWETPDLAALSGNLNNNVPREAAFAYDDIDVSTAYQRGDRPTQGWTASVYGSPDTTLYQLAEAEETDGNDTDFTVYFGQPGNRVAIAGADTKIKFQQNRMGFAGALRQSTINVEATPYNSPPLTYTASISQTETFLTASS